MLRLLIRYSGNRRKLRPSWLPVCYWRLVLPGPTAFRILRRARKSIMACPNDWAAKSLPHQLRPGVHPIFGDTPVCSKQPSRRLSIRKRLTILSSLLTSLNAQTQRHAWRGKRHARPRLGLDWSKASTSRYSHCRRLAVTRVRPFRHPRMSLPTVSSAPPSTKSSLH